MVQVSPDTTLSSVQCPKFKDSKSHRGERIFVIGKAQNCEHIKCIDGCIFYRYIFFPKFNLWHMAVDWEKHAVLKETSTKKLIIFIDIN